jgi:hypothetical protein
MTASPDSRLSTPDSRLFSPDSYDAIISEKLGATSCIKADFEAGKPHVRSHKSFFSLKIRFFAKRMMVGCE